MMNTQHQLDFLSIWLCAMSKNFNSLLLLFLLSTFPSSFHYFRAKLKSSKSKVHFCTMYSMRIHTFTVCTISQKVENFKIDSISTKSLIRSHYRNNSVKLPKRLNALSLIPLSSDSLQAQHLPSLVLILWMCLSSVSTLIEIKFNSRKGLHFAMDNGLRGSSRACLSVSLNQQDLRSVQSMVMEYGFVLFCFLLCLPRSSLDFWVD